MSFLLQKGADPNGLVLKDRHEAPVFRALARGMTWQLIEQYASAGVDFGAVDRKGRSALYYAARGGNIHTMERLRQAGTPWPDGRADTPGAALTAVPGILMQAARGGHKATLEWLVDEGLDPFQEDHKGRPFVDLCLSLSDQDLVAFSLSLAARTKLRQRPRRAGSPRRIALG
jgi:ankyrin repeat protein